ncbi:MAG: GNAT family N-acetyltransferase [Oscillospiraceae bacterium]|nr:GNAT family N-acetyltransferase [Oscillospiraceae bacterium]
MIRRACEADIPSVAAIYDRILSAQDRGILFTGWVRGVYPTKQTAQDALNAGELFVLEEEGSLLAAAKINQQQVNEYVLADWKYDVPEDQIMVLHTLVVDPEQSGRGYGTRFVRFYEHYAQEHGCKYLRMDTNVINSAARKLYRGLGYQEVGIVPCRFNGIPNVRLVCLEKCLEENQC